LRCFAAKIWLTVEATVKNLPSRGMLSDGPDNVIEPHEYVREVKEP
jgi:hypothetical protein